MKKITKFIILSVIMANSFQINAMSSRKRCAENHDCMEEEVSRNKRSRENIEKKSFFPMSKRKQNEQKYIDFTSLLYAKARSYGISPFLMGGIPVAEDFSKKDLSVAVSLFHNPEYVNYLSKETVRQYILGLQQLKGSHKTDYLQRARNPDLFGILCDDVIGVIYENLDDPIEFYNVYGANKRFQAIANRDNFALQSLNLEGKSISDISSFRALLRKARPQRINFHNCTLKKGMSANAVLLAIHAECPELYSLFGLGPFNISDLVLSRVDGTSLRTDSIGTREELRALRFFTSLCVLDLSFTSIRDFGLLRFLTNLHTLDLTGCKINDLEPLASLRNLHTLYLRGVQIGHDQIEALRRAIPGITIII